VKPEQAIPLTAQAAFLADTQTVDQHVVVIAQVVQVLPFPGIRVSHQPLAEIAVFPACAGENGDKAAAVVVDVLQVLPDSPETDIPESDSSESEEPNG
jgi:hypothetical protein